MSDLPVPSRTTLEALLAEGARAVGLLDARVLLQHALAVGRAHLIARAEAEVPRDRAEAYRALIARRVAGEPVAYLTGSREFYGLEFRVTPAVLIPRPETELLVELALARIPKDRPARVLDLGTGSGAVAIAIAHQRPRAAVAAVDLSAEALEVAAGNAGRLLAGIANLRFLRSDWFAALEGETFDLIVANPPYVAEGDPHLAEGDLRFEPAGALVATGADGLDCIRRIVSDAPAHLEPGGWLLFEHGFEQGAGARAALEPAGFGDVFTARDLAGHDRITGGRCSSLTPRDTGR